MLDTVPAAHGVHAPPFSELLNVPSGQTVQRLSADNSYPPSQLTHVEGSVAEHVPWVQSHWDWHVRSDSEVGAVTSTSPAEHVVTALHWLLSVVSL